jgi:excisionase family DNA binding protein
MGAFGYSPAGRANSVSRATGVLFGSRFFTMKLWTIQEIVDVTGFSESKVRRAIRAGELQSSKIKRSRRISHEWLVAWLQCDPFNQALILSISRTVKTSTKSTTTTTRIEKKNQMSLFDS